MQGPHDRLGVERSLRLSALPAPWTSPYSCPPRINEVFNFRVQAEKSGTRRPTLWSSFLADLTNATQDDKIVSGKPGSWQEIEGTLVGSLVTDPGLMLFREQGMNVEINVIPITDR